MWMLYLCLGKGAVVVVVVWGGGGWGQNEVHYHSIMRRLVWISQVSSSLNFSEGLWVLPCQVESEPVHAFVY